MVLLWFEPRDSPQEVFSWTQKSYQAAISELLS